MFLFRLMRILSHMIMPFKISYIFHYVVNLRIHFDRLKNAVLQILGQKLDKIVASISFEMVKN